MTIDDLPPPDVVEPLDYEAVLAALKADLAARLPQIAPTLELESEPLVKLLEVAAYRETLLRARINDAARAGLLAFAGGGDLDHLAAFYGVARLPGEADAALRERVRARISGWANAGGAAHYRYWALSASADIQDIAVVSPLPGLVRICVLARDGADREATLDAVRRMLARDDVRVLTDTVEVVDAQMRPLVVRARLWRLPDALPQRAAELAERLARQVRESVRLGWDATRSWLIARLHAEGVHRVELLEPTDDLRCAPHEAVRLERVEVQDMGVDL